MIKWCFCEAEVNDNGNTTKTKENNYNFFSLFVVISKFPSTDLFWLAPNLLRASSYSPRANLPIHGYRCMEVRRKGSTFEFEYF